MGYQSFSSVINMGFSSLWFIYYPIFIALVFAARKILKKIDTTKKYHDKATKLLKNVWEESLINFAIIFLNENYMLISTSFFLNCLLFKFDTYGNTICALFTILLGIISYGFPIFVAVFYSVNFERTQEV